MTCSPSPPEGTRPEGLLCEISGPCALPIPCPESGGWQRVKGSRVGTTRRALTWNRRYSLWNPVPFTIERLAVRDHELSRLLVATRRRKPE